MILSWKGLLNRSLRNHFLQFSAINFNIPECIFLRSISRVNRFHSLHDKRALFLSHFGTKQWSPCGSCTSFRQFCNSTPRYNTTSKPGEKRSIDVSQFSVEHIRNFSIVAHIDHGKSTLADRLLEWTGTINKSSDNKQVLDKLQVERERGITVKAQTASLFYTHKGTTYLLNLIDTPGHVDFSYEVSRSLAACQGIILLVDALQGVQAQTVANFFLAFDSDLTTLPVLNKIDLKNADPARVAQQLNKVFDVEEGEIIKVSAKEGIGIEDVLSSVVERVPPPPCDVNKPLSALLFDSWFDQYKGVICLVAVKSGQVKKGDDVSLAATGEQYEVMDVGIMYPNEVSTGALSAGQVGYLICGIRSTKEAKTGDTFFHTGIPVQVLPGFKDAKPMVFAGIYPVDQSEYVYLRSSIERLTLNDASVSVHPDSSTALGQGWRLGFLGLLHMDVFQQRLQQEYNASIIITSPSVPYKAIRIRDQKEVLILSPIQFPEPNEVEMYLEPFILGTIIFPDEYMGKVLTLCESRRGVQKEVTYIDEHRVMLKYDLPLNEIIIDFFDELKSVSSGFASFDYEDNGYRESDLVKLDILINGQKVDALTCISHKDKTLKMGKEICSKLHGLISRQLFEVVIQAAIRGKVIARSSIKALRKDVTAKCYGGDITRKMKLLQKQKEGKKKLKKIGRVEIPHEAFLSLLKR